MKFSSKSANRSLTLALIVGTLGLGIAGATHAQHGTSGQGSATGQGSAAGQGSSTPKSSEKSPHGILDGGMDNGKVDQKIRNERNKGVKSASPPPVRKNEKGIGVEDPSKIQGGSIGPN